MKCRTRTISLAAGIAVAAPAGAGEVEVVYSTLIGGNSADEVFDLAVDAMGNVSITGYSASDNFPLAPETPNGFWDMIVAKLNPDGTDLVYSHYIPATTQGTPVTEYGTGIDADADGNAYVTGRTTALDFPTMEALQPESGGLDDAIVMKLNPEGEVLFSTYLGGSAEENLGTPSVDRVGEIVVDDLGFIYVAGNTRSDDFPLVNPIDDEITGDCGIPCSDLFLVKLTPDGQSIVFSTFLGGDGMDDSVAMKIGPDGAIYLLSHRGVSELRKIAPDGSRVLWTFTFPTMSDGGSIIAHDFDVGEDGRVYIGGETSTFEFPTTPGVWQEEHGGSFDGHVWQGFVVVLDPQGTTIETATYLGLATDNERVTALGVDSFGNVLIGFTRTDHFGSVTVTHHLWKLDEALAERLVFLDLGGSGEMTGMHVDDENNIRYAGWVWDGDVDTLTPGAFQTTPGGNIDAFVTHMDLGDAPDVPGDLDGDGSVGFSDLLILLAAWGDCPPPPAECAADLDDSGAVGFSDLIILLANW